MFFGAEATQASNDIMPLFITLLQDMLSEIHNEKQDAAKLFEKTQRACNDYQKRTTNSIEGAETKITELQVRNPLKLKLR